jgi:hypothetical protein
MKVFVIIDHPIICRHFVMSGALSRLIAEAEVRFVFPAAGNRRFPLDLATLPLGAPFERLTIDDKRQQIWRWMLFADRLRWMTLGWKAALTLTLAGLSELLVVLARLVKRVEGAARGVALKRAAEHFAAPWRERIVDFRYDIVAAQRGA